MSETRGGTKKRKAFTWDHLPAIGVAIVNEHGAKHQFTIAEIAAVLERLRADFGGRWFPLGNDAEQLGGGSQRPGMGMAILAGKPGDIRHAQGASYLGVVLEECGYLRWNGQVCRIQWRLIADGFTTTDVANRLDSAIQRRIQSTS